MPASRFLKIVQETGQIPVCSFYLPVSTSRNPTVAVFCKLTLECAGRTSTPTANMEPDQPNAETRVATARLAGLGARGKRRGFSPGAAARHSQSARVRTEFIN